MELDISRISGKLILAALLIILVALGGLGATITPDPSVDDVLLTPHRWHSLRLLRQVQAEIESLNRDAVQLDALLRAPTPAPVEAMLLAQRIYAHHARGASATTGARQALITAAEMAARASVGAASRAQAIQAFATALDLIDALVASQTAQISPLSPQPPSSARPPLSAHPVFIPLVVRSP